MYGYLIIQRLLQLLMYICGSKEKYRQLRDLHTLETHVSEVHKLCDKVIKQERIQGSTLAVLPYDVLVSLVRSLTLFINVG